MKHLNLQFVLAVLGVLLSLNTKASVLIDGIYYNLNTDEKTADVTSGDSKYTGEVLIPCTVTYNGVTYSVTTIDEMAFAECSGLTSITIPKGVTIIDGAFYGCSGLTSVTIPSSVTSINELTFAECSGLTSISVAEGNSVYDSRDNSNAIIETSTNTLIVACNNTTIPSSVKTIGRGAFFSCNRALTSVTIPEGVTTIGEWAFSWCMALTSVTIPESVTTIGKEAFYQCSALTSITIPSSVTNIEANAFKECFGLTSISVAEGNSIYDSRDNCNAIIETSTNTLIVGCNNTTIPNSVITIGNNAFWSRWGLTSVTIPESVTNIGERAFEGCTGLTSLTIPSSVTSIGEAAFSNCSGLTSLTIPSSVTSIGDGAFSGSSRSLTSISVAEGNSIYDSRDNCNAIIETSTNALIVGCNNTIIPSNVTSICASAFLGCSGLTSLDIPNSVTSISEKAFMGCSGLTSIIIPNSVTSIDDLAFWNCSSLTSVTIPNSVTSIGKQVFSGCSSLTSVISEIETPFVIDYYTFFDFLFKSNCILTVPQGTKDAYIAAGWTTEFFKGGIVEDVPTPATVSVTLGSLGVATFCSEYDLDFSEVEGVKAYIVSAFTPSTAQVTLTRMMDVPGNTGLVLLGDKGTYNIPISTSGTIVSNLLRGVTTATTLNKVDGNYTNYILANGDNDLGFYAVSNGSTLAAGKAYLPLPTTSLPALTKTRSISFVLEDGNTFTGIEPIQTLRKDGLYYNLNGLRVEHPTKGIYIKDGKKVLFM